MLIEKGFVAIRNGPILKIVNRKDEMVSQILSLRYGEVTKLVQNLHPLLSENATISANESANLILLTDPQTNILRVTPDGKTVVIGGLMPTSKVDSVRKIPLPGDIPGVLGLPFRFC